MSTITNKGKIIAGSEQQIKDADYINKCARMIEMSLEAFGIMVKVVNIEIMDKFYEYQLDVAVGTDFKILEKKSRELAMALAAPTGKVYWRIPIPGRALIGLKVPKPSKEYFEEIERDEQARLKGNDLRSKIALMFYVIGKLNFLVSYKILGDPKKQ